MAKGSGHHRAHGMPHGFVSKAQWRYFFVNSRLREQYAHKEAHKTPGGPKVRYRRLPEGGGARSRLNRVQQALKGGSR